MLTIVFMLNMFRRPFITFRYMKNSVYPGSEFNIKNTIIVVINIMPDIQNDYEPFNF